MPIRATCPSCGRSVRAQDRAVGLEVRCPGCSHRYRLTADMVESEDDDRPARPSVSRGDQRRPESSPSPVKKPKPRPQSVPADDRHGFDEESIALPGRSIAPRPIAPAYGTAEGRDLLSGLNLPMPVMIGGMLSVAMLAIVVLWSVAGMFRHRNGDVARPAVAAADSPSEIGPGEALEDDATPPTSVDEPVTKPARGKAKIVALRDDDAGNALSTADIVAESEPSVALIKGKLTSGTGFLVAPGLIATNAHVVSNEFMSSLEIRFVSADEDHKSPIQPELLYEDHGRDLAFLSVQTDLPPLRVAGTYAFRKGEDITVIGNPGLGDGQVLENAISRGVMSTKTRLENQTFYQLGIAVNPGNSGGPVFDSSGRVIGVVTLKSSKQEATSFSIPIEDVHEALAKLTKETPEDLDLFRSRHRINAALEGLASGGALMCLTIDLRRINMQAGNTSIKEMLGKIEPITTEIDGGFYPALIQHAPQIENDPRIARPIKSKLADLNKSYEQIRNIYSTRRNIDNNQFRPLKQTHKRLLTELAASINAKIPPGLMTAFDDHIPSQPPTIITMGPQNLGPLGPRFQQRMLPHGPGIGAPLPGPRIPGRIQRPVSPIDRFRQRGRR